MSIFYEDGVNVSILFLVFGFHCHGIAHFNNDLQLLDAKP